MTTSEIATVLAWHDALNGADIDTLLALSSDDIEVGDAHGAAQGHTALKEWVTADPAQMPKSPGSSSTRVWSLSNKRSPAQANPAPRIASAFRVVHDHVTSVFRHDDLAAALAATELTDADLVD